MEKYELEFPIKASNNLLYKRIATPSGLSEWFSDDVFVKQDKYTFIWEGSEQVAFLLENKRNESIKFRWEENEDDTYFELAIRKSSLTGDNSLIITDFAEDDELEDASLLWEQQISELKSVLGL